MHEQHCLLVIVEESNHKPQQNPFCCATGLSFKKNPQALSGGDLEEGQGLQGAGPGTVGGSPVSLSSSLPFTPISLIFKVHFVFPSCHCCLRPA